MENVSYVGMQVFLPKHPFYQRNKSIFINNKKTTKRGDFVTDWWGPGISKRGVFPTKWVGVYEDTLIIMELHGVPWMCMEKSGQYSMENFSMEMHGNPCISMAFSCSPWTSERRVMSCYNIALKTYVSYHLA